MYHRKRFLSDNPHLKPVAGSEHEKLLKWALKAKILGLPRWGNRLYYSDGDLDVAQSMYINLHYGGDREAFNKAVREKTTEELC